MKLFVQRNLYDSFIKAKIEVNADEITTLTMALKHYLSWMESRFWENSHDEVLRGIYLDTKKALLDIDIKNEIPWEVEQKVK